MKTRLDFVSNSSSSSYIVAVVPKCTDAAAAQCIAKKCLAMNLKKLNIKKSKTRFDSKKSNKSVTGIIIDHKKQIKLEKINFKAEYTNENEKIEIMYIAPIKSPVKSLKTSEEGKIKKSAN